jgi:hypothetical protein
VYNIVIGISFSLAFVINEASVSTLGSKSVFMGSVEKGGWFVLSHVVSGLHTFTPKPYCREKGFTT